MATLSRADLRLLRCWRSDYRAGLRDVFGIRVLTPAQEKHVELLARYPRVAACGGTGTGKSFVQGVVARLVSMLWPSKFLFGGPKQEQAARLSWLEFQRAHDRAVDRGLNPGGTLLTTEWQGPTRDWFAVCMALSDRNNAAAVKGMLHAPVVGVVLDELEGVAPEVRDALDSGTTQDNAHYWFAFNPVRPDDAAGRFWTTTPPEARVRYSALECAEWQERTGHRIPGMPTMSSIAAKWRGRENDPLYYTNVLGEFPPESATWVVVPRDWFDACVDVNPQGVLGTGIGVDTAGGRAENVVAVVDRGRVTIVWHSREQHQTPALVARIKEIANRYTAGVPIAIDVVGLGGKGVADQLRADGYNALDFAGGSRTFAGLTEESSLYADAITWAWFALRDAVRVTVEGQPVVRLPNDDVLREQLSRKYTVTGERRYKLEPKEAGNSPDRADAVAMAWLAATVGAGSRIQHLNLGVV